MSQYASYSGYLGGATGTVTSVTASSPIASSGGATPNISLTGIVPIANGGTGSATQNFVDLTTGQTVAGAKTFSSDLTASSTSTTAFKINSTSLVMDATSNLLGIGTAPVAGRVIDINSDTSASGKNVIITGYGIGATSGFRAQKSRGTFASPTAVQSGDNLGIFGATGYGTTGFATAGSCALMQIIAEETFSDTAAGSRLVFSTTANTTVVRTERMRINNTGRILMGTTTDDGLNGLQVAGGVSIQGSQTSKTRVATATPVTVSATTDYGVFCKLSVAGAVAVGLPVAVNGQEFIIKDATGDANSNNITITRAGSDTFEGGGTSLVINTAFGKVHLMAQTGVWYQI